MVQTHLISTKNPLSTCIIYTTCLCLCFRCSFLHFSEEKLDVEHRLPRLTSLGEKWHFLRGCFTSNSHGILLNFYKTGLHLIIFLVYVKKKKQKTHFDSKLRKPKRKLKCHCIRNVFASPTLPSETRAHFFSLSFHYS